VKGLIKLNVSKGSWEKFGSCETPTNLIIQLPNLVLGLAGNFCTPAFSW